MAAALGFPFTLAQMKELERQAIIYKYIMASLPVPPHLLSPITHFSTWGLGFSKSKHEAEPGRCRRTDGKKWRCSRDVAPHHKYCERHLHRGRPRSRKPVEAHTHFIKKKTRLHHHTLPPDPTGSTLQSNETPPFPDKTNGNVSVSSYEEPSRGLDWSMEGEMLAMDDSEHQWQNMLQTTEGASVLQQNGNEMPPNLIPYTDFGVPEIDHQNDDCSLFLNPELISLQEEPEIETPRGFIDAWSNESSVSSKTLSPSSLKLSMAMAAGEALDKEMGQIEMGLGVGDWEHNPPQVSSWLSSVSRVGSAPGGPLAEMLLPSSNSSYACNGDSAMPFQWLN